MARTTFGIRELLAQLGIKDTNELEVIENLQPVLVAGDASGLTSTLLGPTAYAGASITGGGGQFPGYRVDPSPSGAWLRNFTLAISAANTPVAWRITPSGTTLTYAVGPTAKTMQQAGPRPSLSVFSEFQTTIGNALGTPDNPSLGTGAAGIPIFLEDIYIPPNHIFECSARQTGAIQYAMVIVQDATANLSPLG